MLEEAHDSSPAFSQAKLSCEARLHFMSETHNRWLSFNVMVCLFLKHSNSVMLSSICPAHMCRLSSCEPLE